MRKNSTNYTDSVICRKCYHPKQKKMYKNPALFHLTEPLSKDTPARCSGILKHIHGSINFHFFFLHLCQVNNGKIRGYVLLGSLLGAWIYYSFCSRFVMRYLTEKIHYLKKRLKKFREMTTIKLNKLRKRKKPEESEKEHEKN